MKKRSIYLFIILSGIAFYFFPACKKSNSNQNQNPSLGNGTYSANIDGVSWQADTIFALDSSGYIEIVGMAKSGTYYPIVEILFPDNMSANTTFNFDINQPSFLEYTPTNGTLFAADGKNGATGSVTLSKFDKTAFKIEGSFQGTVKDFNYLNPKVFSNGQFSTKYHY